MIARASRRTGFAFCREPGQSIAEAFANDPCGVPVALEPRGEAVAFVADGSAHFTLSGLVGLPLHRSDRLDRAPSSLSGSAP